MALCLFEFRDYKSYLKDWIAARPSKGRGERTQMADHLRCHNTYLTHVLEGKADLSAEQADLLNGYLGHSAEEGRYFLLLVQMQRAGTPSLRAFWSAEIDTILEQRQILKNRLVQPEGVAHEIGKQDQAQYYSAWHFLAIHLAVGLEHMDSIDALARELGLHRKIVAEALEFLESRGLIRSEGGRYTLGPTSTHLGKGSPMLARHHANWRLQAMRAMERDPDEGLHYSSVVTMGKADIPRAKEVLIRAIEEVRAIVRPSPNEELCCYLVDFFDLEV